MVCLVPEANAQISADILWLVDTSGSMAGDIAEVQTRIGQFNDVMMMNGIDAYYGLVEFGSGETLTQDIVPFSTFNASGSPFMTISTGGGFEQGSEAINVGLANANFRSNSVRNVILVTDEDDDSDLTEFNNAIASLTASNALFNFIGVPGVGNTDSRYGVLANDFSGAAFNILDFRNNPGPFFDNFINTKVQEIIENAPENPPEQTPSVPEPNSLTMLGVLSLFGAKKMTQKVLTKNNKAK
ncbi:hypothetical protein CY0110_20675 [Crocosphaera chwakensis CCY0110]|uniref:VWFA domain-containing protein n=2 Tax=Crocosphaera TaxID=263510 RepID=A3IU22_9CHRO|nr:hypothetical protein CY0110_20675 [Crocosphaera chwakensis CCY0110]